MLSFRRRLLLVHLGVIVAVLVVTALAAHYMLARAIHAQLDAALFELAEIETGLAQEGGQPAVHDAVEGSAPPSFMRLDRLVQIIDAEGHPLARSHNLGGAHLPVSRELLARLRVGEAVYETHEPYGQEAIRVVSLPIEKPGPAFAVQVAGSLDDANRVMRTASILFVIMGVALLVTVGAAGTKLAGRAFGAIEAIVAQANRIGESNFAERLPHPGTRDEIGRLVDTLNEMLERLERSYEVQRRFTADASHELRSPLSRLRAEMEITLRRKRDPAEYAETLGSCMEEVDRLTLLVENLLTLARVDAGPSRPAPQTAVLNRVVNDAVRQLEAFAIEKRVRIEVTPAQSITAHAPEAPLNLVLVNLLDNAVKFSTPGGRVTIDLGARGNEAVMAVSDSGPGIDPEDLPHVFERFYRGAQARSGAKPGFGIGLSLSRAIVQAHGGHIEAANRDSGGATFTVYLPIAA